MSMPCSEKILSCLWGSDPLNISATHFSTQGSYGDKCQACSSRVLLLSDGAKILPRVASEKKEKTMSENTRFAAEYQMHVPLIASSVSGNWCSSSIFWVVKFSGISVCFRGITDYLHGLFLCVRVSDCWWCPRSCHAGWSPLKTVSPQNCPSGPSVAK